MSATEARSISSAVVNYPAIACARHMISSSELPRNRMRSAHDQRR